MPVSDFPPAFASGLRPQAFPDRPADGLRRRPAGTDGISRFSCMERPRMRRVSDSAGPMTRLAMAPPTVLPSRPQYAVGIPEGVITELNGWPACSPVNACGVPLRARRHDSGPWRAWHGVASGEAGSLRLPRATLSFATPCRFSPALHCVTRTPSRARTIPSPRTGGSCWRANRTAGDGVLSTASRRAVRPRSVVRISRTQPVKR